MALQALLQYEQGGNAALGTYRDKKRLCSKICG
jgi:hypothetical protein